MTKLICLRDHTANPMNKRITLMKGDVFDCDAHSLYMEDILAGFFAVYKEPVAEPVPIVPLERPSGVDSAPVGSDGDRIKWMERFKK